MKIFLYLFVFVCISCNKNGLEVLKVKEGSFACKVNSQTTFQNIYEKTGKKVVFQSQKTLTALAKDFELSVLLDRQCLLQASEFSIFTKNFKHLAKKDFSKYSKIEAYTVKLPSSFFSWQLEEIAQADACVIGVTEETYTDVTSISPNDPRYVEQSYMASIRYPEIYEDVFQSRNKLQGEYIVAVIDTGYFLNHPDLVNRWWINTREIPANGIDDDNNGVVDDIHGANQNSIPASGDPSSFDYAAHGTHVAGFIAAQVNNNEGISGIMGLNARIMAISAWPSSISGGGSGGSQPMSVIDRAIRYAVDNGASVINISMQGEGLNPNIEAAMNYAVQKNVVVVVAAGNNARELGSSYIGVPAYYTKSIQGAISVAASDAANGDLNGVRCAFSNYSSSYVEIAAPGCDTNININGVRGILSCVPRSANSSMYGYNQGTSMASPIVAAGAMYTYAILKEMAHQNPTAAKVEEVLLLGSRQNVGMQGVTKDAKHLDLKSIYDYVHATYVNPGPMPTPAPSPIPEEECSI